MDRVVLVILTLGVVALVCLSGVIYLAAHQLAVPDVLVATTGAAGCPGVAAGRSQQAHLASLSVGW